VGAFVALLHAFLTAFGWAPHMDAWPSTAQAQPSQVQARVIVQGFSGPHSGDARKAVLRSFKQFADEVEVVSDREVAATERKLGITTYTQDDFARVASELWVTAVIRGRVEDQGGRWVAQVEVWNPYTNKVVGQTTWASSSKRFVTSMEKTSYAHLRPHILQANKGGNAIVQGSGRQGATTAPWASGMAEPPPPKKRIREADETPWNPHGSVVEEGPGDAESLSSARATGSDSGASFVYKKPWLTLALQLGMLSRNLQAQALVYNRTRSGGQPDDVIPEERSYNSGGLGAPELGVLAEFFPGKLLDSKVLEHIGLIASVRQSMLLSSSACRMRDDLRTPCADEERITIGTSQSELFGGLRGRLQVGDADQPLILQADAGIGIFSFAFNVDDLKQVEFPSVVPSLSYTYTQLAAGLRYVISPYFQPAAQFAYRIGMNQPDTYFVWGGATTGANATQPLTGPSSGYLFGLEVRSEAPYLFEGAFISLLFDYFAFSTTFRGQAGCAPGVNCEAGGQADWDNNNPWEIWPTDQNGVVAPGIGGIQSTVSDNYMRLGLAIGFMLR
jgi:hypothetical protein